MYYLPPFYYWIDNKIYNNVYSQLEELLEEHKINYNRLLENNREPLIEKGSEYTSYKSDLIRLILLKYAHENPDKRGKDLLDDLFEKWNENKNIRERIKKTVFERTMTKITKYEKALLIGKRAKQIEEGANPNVKVLPGQSAIAIAEEELRQRKIPLIIKRPLGNTFEYWKPADMEVIMD
jgi:DNA-directed RNA polymerase subunit K/omega